MEMDLDSNTAATLHIEYKENKQEDESFFWLPEYAKPYLKRRKPLEAKARKRQCKSYKFWYLPRGVARKVRY